MAKSLRLNSLDNISNEAINLKKAQLLLDGKEYTKEACVYEILCEWLATQKNCEQNEAFTSLSFNIKS